MNSQCTFDQFAASGAGGLRQPAPEEGHAQLQAASAPPVPGAPVRALLLLLLLLLLPSRRAGGDGEEAEEERTQGGRGRGRGC